jgi:hypothetical protein
MNKFLLRLKKLERRLNVEDRTWALFSIRYYEDPTRQKRAQKRVVDAYIGERNPPPMYRVFISEIPHPSAKSFD